MSICRYFSKGSDTPKSFLSKVAFESNLRKKLSRIEHVLIVKVSFERRKIAKSFHDTRARFLLKVTFEGDFRKKLSSVSLALDLAKCGTYRTSRT